AVDFKRCDRTVGVTFRYDIAEMFCDMLAIVINIVPKLVSYSEEEVWDYVDNNLQHVAEHLRDIIAECNTDGAIATFEIDSEPSPYIRLTAKLPGDVIAKLRKIDPFQLETICA